jgi:hypothetical protein
MKGSENVPPEVETPFMAFIEGPEEDFTQDVHDGRSRLSKDYYAFHDANTKYSWMLREKR